jgi:hypothetical protein
VENGGSNVGMGESAGEDMVLASPVFGQTSNRTVIVANTPFDFTTPCCIRSVESAPAPLFIQLK